MLFRILADTLVLLHLAFVIFAVAGALLAFKWRWIIWLHPPAAIWAAVIEFSGRICPLTPMENSLRIKSGEAGYAGGFVEYYLLPVLYPTELTQSIQISLGMAVLVINITLYWRLFTRDHR